MGTEKIGAGPISVEVGRGEPPPPTDAPQNEQKLAPGGSGAPQLGHFDPCTMRTYRREYF